MKDKLYVVKMLRLPLTSRGRDLNSLCFRCSSVRAGSESKKGKHYKQLF